MLGLATYVCCTGSVPLADAMHQSGLSTGQAMYFLLVGPITSYSSILVIKKEFGGRILAVYLAIISLFSIATGLLYDLFIAR